MSFRDRIKKVVENVAEKLATASRTPVVLPAKECFADGICDICEKPLHTHEGARDCNGWPLVFLDKPQEQVDATRR